MNFKSCFIQIHMNKGNRVFQSYGSGRSQSVSVDGHLSDSLSVSMGVPQGSILGPLLFLLFLNDLPSVAGSCETNMFADDTEIDTAETPECHEDLQNNLNADLHKIKDYLNCNRLSLNIPKCEFMLIDTFQSPAMMPDIHVHIDNEPHNQVTVAIYPGMFIDSNLK